MLADLSLHVGTVHVGLLRAEQDVVRHLTSQKVMFDACSFRMLRRYRFSPEVDEYFLIVNKISRGRPVNFIVTLQTSGVVGCDFRQLNCI